MSPRVEQLLQDALALPEEERREFVHALLGALGSGASSAISGSEGQRNGNLAEHFQDLVRKWKAERGPTSSVAKMAAHPAYREIVSLGRSAVPLLLAELERAPDHWFVALHEITGADPVPKESQGRLKEMAAAWLQWGRANGISW
jgi:hypothetical protein